MEWVEITGRTVEEAMEAALDQLGVDNDDAEFEVLEEPKQGLFGRVRGQARVRARIRPTVPRPKVERRDRRRRNGGNKANQNPTDAPTSVPGPAVEAAAVNDTTDTTDTEGTPSSTGSRPRRRSGKGKPSEQGDSKVSDNDVDLEAHTAIVNEFLIGLVDAFGVDARVETELLDDETAEVRVDGTDLGVLVGPKGNTLNAIQELSRTVVHRRVPGTAAGRVRLDVAGYRQRRRDALERFTRSVADEVRASGVQKALEPMNPADRKVVHDTVNELDGVSTISEGEEPRRRVVIVPA